MGAPLLARQHRVVDALPLTPHRLARTTGVVVDSADLVSPRLHRASAVARHAMSPKHAITLRSATRSVAPRLAAVDAGNALKGAFRVYFL